jgi:hypothetical protein
MAATWKWYGNGLLALAKGDVAFDTDTFKVMLTTDTAAPDQDAHDFRSDVTNEVAASGTYAAGGLTLGSCTVTYDGTSNEVRILWDDVSATSATITARHAIIYKVVGSAATDILIAYASESANVTSTAGTFTVDMPPTAVLKITAAV